MILRLAAVILLVGISPAHPRLLFRLADARIVEASGIAPGIASPGVFYVQNDSGDRNRFFAVDGRTGRTAATITVPGARNVDWEDIAVGPDAGGHSSVWLADIGDNGAARSAVRVYRVLEPRVAASARGRVIRARLTGVWRLRYPSGPVDAESFAVAPDGSAFIVTKSLPRAVVYELPPAPDAVHVQRLRRVASVRVGLATSAAISADGRVLVIRTYTDAYVWRLGRGGVAAALRTRPARILLPAQRQGEGVAVRDGDLIVDSEGAHAPVYAVPIPARPVPGPHRPTSPAASSAASRGPAGSDRSRDWVWAAAAAAAAGAVLFVLVVLRRRTTLRP